MIIFNTIFDFERQSQLFFVFAYKNHDIDIFLACLLLNGITCSILTVFLLIMAYSC